MRVKDAVGRFGEDLAAERLRADGLTVLARNWRCTDGELDIVAAEGHTLVFVEVKTRSTLACGDPAEAVVPAKAARVRRLAARWLVEHPDPYWPQLRFDVVAVVRLSPGGPSVRHVRGAF
ncbi:MAG: YraN family protein [Jatrophihabitantaceae bacterium]